MYDGEFPNENINEILEYLNCDLIEFNENIDRHRNKEIWKLDGNEYKRTFEINNMSIANKIIKDFNVKRNNCVPHSKKLTKGYELNISKFSGLVSVIKRRSSKQIANDWSNKIFGNKFSKDKYTAKFQLLLQDILMF